MSRWVFRSDRHPVVFRLMAETGRKGVFVPFELIHLLEDFASAILLAQILYWSGVVNNRWFYKSAPDWFEELRISKDVLRRCLYGDKRAPNRIALTSIGIETRTARANGAPTTHYRVDYDRLEMALAELSDRIVGLSDGGGLDYPTNDRGIIHQSITEITSEKNKEDAPEPVRGLISKSETPHQLMIRALMEGFNIDIDHATQNDIRRAAQVSKQLRGAGLSPEQIPGLIHFVTNQSGGQWTVTMTSLINHGRVAKFLEAQKSTPVTMVTASPEMIDRPSLEAARRRTNNQVSDDWMSRLPRDYRDVMEDEA